MTDIAVWLEQLGLAKYAPIFSDNEVELADLSELSEDDLKELGLPLGPRRRILKAVRAVDAGDRVPKESTGDVAADAHTRVEAERRQLTVMFCDLVGSTELSGRLDPEDLREVMRRYQDSAAGSIARYDGYLAKFMGDGVLAYFGWPQAYEDQTERAVRAGLDAVRAVGEIQLRDGERLQARVGISTGQVVVGDLVGEVSVDNQAVTGETPNLAARLQGIAEPSQVVIDSLSQRLIGPTFETASLGDQALKGFAKPIEAWQVTSEAAADSRFESLHGKGLTSLIGRDHEFELMRERWARSKGGEGQVLTLSGEAGIGKSRLVRALREDISTQRHFHLRYQCSPHHTNTALFPVVQRLARAAGFNADDSDAGRLSKLEDLLRLATPEIDDIAPLFAALMSVPVDEQYGVVDMTPPERRDRMIEALVVQVMQLSVQRPILFVLEDAHWIDSTTELLIGAIISRIADRAVFVVVTHRPDYAPPWLEHPHVTAMSLNRLGRRQGKEIVQSFGGEGLSPKTVEQIIARADGVPLFIEELTKTLVEIGDETDGHTIPESLMASMTARLDRLGDAKQLAQVGAVIGREFQYPVVVALSGLVEWQAEQALVRLTRSGLIFQQGMPPNATYQFKHALVQDTAYDSLLRRPRRQLHKKLAVLLTDKFPNTAEFEPELLAHHWEQGEDLVRAVHFRIMAAERADKMSALWEAVAHYRHAISLLERTTDTAENRRQFLDVVLALISVRGTFWSNADERAQGRIHADRAIEIARNIPDLSAIARLEVFMSYGWPNEKLMAAAMDHAEASGDELTRASVAITAANFLGYVGRYEQSLANIDRALEIFTRLGDDEKLCMALAATGRCFNARAGRLTYSLELAGRARALAATSGDQKLISWLTMEAEPNFYKGNWQRVIEVTEEGLPVALEIGNWSVAMYACSWSAQANLKLNRTEEARRIIDKGFDCLAQYTEANPATIYMSITRAKVLLSEVNIGDARADAESSRAQAEDKSLLLELGAGCRVLGEINAAAGDIATADSNFRQSLEVLGGIQSQPEFAQSLLAYGRFQHELDRQESMRLFKRALALFEKIGADGWANETIAAFRN